MTSEAYKAILPKGFLDFDSADYAELSLEVQRAVYSECRDRVRYHYGREEADSLIAAKGPITPVEWIMAAKSVVHTCPKCHGSGSYGWGAVINGKISHSGPCFRCGGKGKLDFDDMRRCIGYDNHAIVAAFRGMCA